MKRNRIRRFFQQKQYAIASFILFAVIAAMTGVYLSNRITGRDEPNKTAEEENGIFALDDEDGQESDYVAVNPDQELEKLNKEKEKKAEKSKAASSVIKPKETKTDEDSTQQNVSSQDNTGSSTASNTQTEDGQDGNAQTENQGQEQQNTQAQTTAAGSLHFSPKKDLAWPMEGDVILNYSMDQTVYFATLEQYKYNPAVIISGKVNDAVRAAATGKITKIQTNEETGLTVTMDLGDGYTAVYGQLKEVLYNEGAVVDVGNTIGYIAEPTKYYSVEGSNLYFELMKDKEPVNPMQYLE